MSYITKFIADQSFTTFSELKDFFTKSPFNLDVKESADTFMMCFTDNSDLSRPEVRDCTGIVFEKGSNNLLHFSFPKCYEGILDNTRVQVSYSNITSKNLGVLTGSNDNCNGSNESNDNCSSSFSVKGDQFPRSNMFSEGKDSTVNLFFIGSMIKLYYTEKAGWVLSTSKNLDAKKTFWSSKKSFETLFIDCIELSYSTTYFEFLEGLDPNWCYTYIIQHSENYCTIKVTQCMAFLLNKVNTSTLQEISPDQENFELKSKNISDVLKLKETGTICDNYIIYTFKPDGSIHHRIKVLSNAYIRQQELSGNFPDIGLRYIELLMKDYHRRCEFGDITFQYTKQLRGEMPEELSRFNKIDILTEKAINSIFSTYQNAYQNSYHKPNSDQTHFHRKRHYSVSNVQKVITIELNKESVGSGIPVTKFIVYKKFYSNKNIREIAYWIYYTM